MPAKPQWLLRLPEILTELSALSVPVVDRVIIEKVFRVKRWRAVQLMRKFGGYQAGRTFLLDRGAVLRDLAALRESGDFQHEQRRRQRLTENLEETRSDLAGRRVVIQTAADARQREVAGLPATVRIVPGRLEIDFCGTRDLLTQLFELAQAMTNDFPAFEALCEDKVPRPVDKAGL